MPDQRRYYIANIHKHFRHPDLIYAELRDRSDNDRLVISATMDYVLNACYERYSGEVEGVGRYVTHHGKPIPQAEAPAGQELVQDHAER